MVLKNACFVKDDLNFLSNDIEEVERMLCIFDSDVPFVIKKAVSHLIKGGGKRIRVIIICLMAKMCGCNKDMYIKLAVAVESLHNATLLHDDVVDSAEMRRSKETVSRIWNNKISILSGDYLLSRFLYWISQINANEVTKIMANVSSSIINGEILQMTSEGDLVKGGESYFDVIISKTATLFAAACDSVAVIANGNDEMRSAFKNFGLNLGIAFQIKDDVLDYVSKSEITGKASGRDFIEKKITLPVIIAYNEGTEEERLFWKMSFEDDAQKKSDFQKAVSIIERHNATEKAFKIARVYKNKASSALFGFSHNIYYRYLMRILSSITEIE